MDSEASAFLCAQQKHHRYMTFGKKQRYIEVRFTQKIHLEIKLQQGKVTKLIFLLTGVPVLRR